MVSSKWSKSEKGQVYTQDASLFTSMTGCRASLGVVTPVSKEMKPRPFFMKERLFRAQPKPPVAVGVVEPDLVPCELGFNALCQVCHWLSGAGIVGDCP